MHRISSEIFITVVDFTNPASLPFENIVSSAWPVSFTWDIDFDESYLLVNSSDTSLGYSLATYNLGDLNNMVIFFKLDLSTNTSTYNMTGMISGIRAESLRRNGNDVYILLSIVATETHASNFLIIYNESYPDPFYSMHKCLSNSDSVRQLEN